MSKKTNGGASKVYRITPQEQADLGRRREMYQFENYKAKLLLEAIESEIDQYIQEIRKRLAIEDDKEIQLDIKSCTITVIDKKDGDKS